MTVPPPSGQSSSSSKAHPSTLSLDTSRASRESAFTRIISAAKRAVSPSPGRQDRTIGNGVAAVFVEHGRLSVPSAAVPTSPPTSNPAQQTAAPSSPPKFSPIQKTPDQKRTINPDIFLKNMTRFEKETIELPEIGGHIDKTPQLVLCANLLSKSVDLPSPSHIQWQQKMDDHPLEKEHIGRLTVCMVDQFIMHPTKDSEAVREIVLLGPVLGKEHYCRLLNSILEDFDKRVILDVSLLQGLIQLVQDAPSGYLKADDMILILRSIRKCLEDPAQQSEENSVNLTQALSKVLDIMEQNKVKDLDRKEEHEPLLKVLTALRAREDPFLKYQALYAFQALQWVPDDETALQGFLRHLKVTTGGLIKMSGMVSLAFDGVAEGLPAVVKGGQGLFGDLKDALGLTARESWYQAIRGAEVLVRNGQLVDLNRAICEAECLHVPWYQWGICQLLGSIAVDSTWVIDARGQALTLLGEMYTLDQDSTRHQDIRKWVLTILTCMSNLPSSADNDVIKAQALKLREDLQSKVRETPFLYSYLLNSRVPLPRSSSLLNEVNFTPELELQLARLRLERLEGYTELPVYIPPLSKPSLQAAEDTLSPLEERVTDFLKSEHGQVMLILGDSGAGKSSFNLRLEHDLWAKYRADDPIPLFIDLKSVDVMDKDMIRTHLLETNLFSKEQIVRLRESKRQFILICDGYDECRKRPDLHAINRLNRPRQWMAKMVIACRSQYLNSSYQTYFAPKVEGTARQRKSRLAEVFKEAVIIPFDEIQIKSYIEAYIAVPETQELFGDRPVWTADYFMDQLRKVTALMDLVKNPFLLMLMLDALPRISGAGRDLSSFRITRVKLYNEYIFQHFGREMERLIEQRSNGKMKYPDPNWPYS